MHRSGIRICAILALLSLAPASLAAQSVRGVVIGAGDQPVPGVVVFLVDSASAVAARAVSDARGEFRLASRQAGTYRLRTLRIGFRPMTSDPIVLATNREVMQRLVLSNVPVALDAMRVVDRSECRAFSDSGAATFAVWEQIRAALTAAQIAEASRSIAFTMVVFARTFDREGGRVLRQRGAVTTDFATHAWLTPPPDSLRRTGYVVTDRDNTVEYYAPGFDPLLSRIFVEDHCFRLSSDRAQPGLVGLAFEPTPERRKGVPEVRGTLWIDRATLELRRLELRYVNLSPLQEEHAGGQLEFMRMRDGTWAVSRWDIHMPRIEQFVIPGHGAEDRVTAIEVSSGELALARRGDDTLWSEPPRALAGVVVDSSSGRPVVGARVQLAGTQTSAISDDGGRFTLSGVLPGEYTIDVRTSSLDSLNSVFPLALTVTDLSRPVELRVASGAQLASSICGSANAAAGIVVGRVLPISSSTNARVSAEWRTDSGHVRRMEAQTTTDGSFRLCRLPLHAAVTLRASTDGAESADATTVRLSPESRLARAQLRLESSAVLASRAAVFTGVVVFDSTRTPIAGAEVALPDIGKTTLTDEKGSFRLADIPPGEHRIFVRHLGYGAADTPLTFHGNETVERRIVLGRAVVLETVNITEHTVDREMASFEEHRRLGLGSFLTRADLAKVEGVTLGSILKSVSGTTVVGGQRGAAWLQSSRYFSFQKYGPDAQDAFQGAPVAMCYTQVYLDKMLIFDGRPGPDGRWPPLFNLNSLNAAQIEAIEYYPSPAETPMEYSRMESHCGVLVIWTRRSP